jgi:hypothetical protein
VTNVDSWRRPLGSTQAWRCLCRGHVRAEHFRAVHRLDRAVVAQDTEMDLVKCAGLVTENVRREMVTTYFALALAPATAARRSRYGTDADSVPAESDEPTTITTSYSDARKPISEPAAWAIAKLCRTVPVLEHLPPAGFAQRHRGHKSFGAHAPARRRRVLPGLNTSRGAIRQGAVLVD